MPVPTLTDFENGKANLDHLDELLTSTELTSTDRLGQEKRTWAGVLAELDAEAIANQTLQIRQAAEAAVEEISNLIDALAVTALPEFATVALGIAGTSSGAKFTVNQASGVSKYLYLNEGGTARFLSTVPIGAAGRQVSALLAKNTELYLEAAPLPAYSWNMIESRGWDGRLVPNRGTKGLNSDPHLVINPGGFYALDNDGTHTGHARIVNDPAVTDPLGRNEAVSVTFGATTHHLTILYRFDNDSATTPTPAADLVVSAQFLQKGATVGKLAIGSSSASAGEKTLFDTTGAWTARSVTMAAWEGIGKAYSIVIRPQAGASGEGTATFPFDVSIYDLRVTDPLSGETLLSMADLRNARRAGHALAPHALPGSMNVSAGGAWTPDDAGNRTPNLQVSLEPETVTSFHMYAIVKVDTLPPSSNASFMAYHRTETTNEAPYSKGRLGVKGELEARDLKGRVDYQPNSNQSAQINPFYLDGSGYVCIARNFGQQQEWNVPAEPVTDEMWMQGMPAFQRGAVAMAAGFIPRMMSLAGQDTSMKAYQGGASGVLGSGTKIVKLLYEPNVARTHEQILARFQADMDTLPELAGLRSTFKVMTMWDGDSTMDFRGSPAYETSRQLRGVGRAFLNHSRGGSYWHRANNLDSSTHYMQARRTNLRRTAFRTALSLGYRKCIYMYCPGENEFNGDAAFRLESPLQEGIDLLNTWVFEERDLINAEYGGERRHIPVLITMKISHTFETWVRDKIQAYYEAVRAIYTERPDPVNAPLLYRRPGAATGGNGYDYMIDMGAWAPELEDGSVTWANWSELAAQAHGKPNNDPDPAARIISGDGQHWTQVNTTYNEGNPHAAVGVHIPSLAKIFELEGVA